MTRGFLFLLSPFLISALVAQYKQDGPLTINADMLRQYSGVKSYILRAAEQMPPQDYNFKPTPPQRTFGGWIADVADSQMTLCSGISGTAQDIKAASKTTKTEVVAALTKSFQACDRLYSNLTDANANDLVPGWSGTAPRVTVLAANVAHNNECYGAMAVYLRLRGFVPPSSQPRR